MKLTRKQIKEGLQIVPIKEIILGAGNPTGQTLTASQIKFAQEIAEGKTKAEAYRKSRPNGRISKAKPASASRRGQELAANSAIQAQIEAFKLAMQAQAYLLPAHLRAMTIHQLTMKALDPDIAPAQQIKCLELIGKMTEVSLFTERREIVHTNSSDSLRDQLLSSLKLAIRSSNAIDVTAKTKADQLLAELSDDYEPPAIYNNDADDQPDQQDHYLAGDGLELPDHQTPPHPTTGKQPFSGAQLLHSIPHNQSPTNLTLTPVRVTIPLESDTSEGIGINPNGGGVKNIEKNDVDVDRETPPL